MCILNEEDGYLPFSATTASPIASLMRSVTEEEGKEEEEEEEEVEGRVEVPPLRAAAPVELWEWLFWMSGEDVRSGWK